MVTGEGRECSRASLVRWYEDLESERRSTVQQACCSPLPPRYIANLLRAMDPDWYRDFRGYGFPIPGALGACRVLVLGCDNGRDALVASALVGDSGSVVGVEWRPDRYSIACDMLSQADAFYGIEDAADSASNASGVALKDYEHFSRGRISYIKAFPEELDTAVEGPFDIVIANCVLSSCRDRIAVMRACRRLLGSGGEIMFTDIVCGRPKVEFSQMGLHFFLQGELQSCAKAAGWEPLRIVSRESVRFGRPDGPLFSLLFEICLFRMFACADRAEVEVSEDVPISVTYSEGMLENGRFFDLDEDHRFILGRSREVDAVSARMLRKSRYGRFFTFGKGD